MFCHHENTRVVDKRDNPDTGITRRRRECMLCKKRFTTYERVERVLLNVEKRDGRVVEFDREKLKFSIFKAMSKRPVNSQQIEDLIDDVEQKLLTGKKSIVKSTDLGQMVLERLKVLDKIAYLRFVSIYREFDTVDKFKKEIEMIEKL